VNEKENEMSNLDNLNPHAEARLAMAWWSEEYAAQRGGCMDFWEGLDAPRKAMCKRVVDGILKAAEDRGRAEPT
jgi:hypothetical protein